MGVCVGAHTWAPSHAVLRPRADPYAVTYRNPNTILRMEYGAIAIVVIRAFALSRQTGRECRFSRRTVPVSKCVTGASLAIRTNNDPPSNVTHAAHSPTPSAHNTAATTLHRPLNATLRAALEYDQAHADRRCTRPEFVIFGGIFAALVAVACVACHHHGPEHEREGAGGSGS